MPTRHPRAHHRHVVRLTSYYSLEHHISWWRTVESSTTIEHLDCIWSRAFWFRKSSWNTAVFSINRFEILEIASLLAPICNFFCNPLLQLSITTPHTVAEADRACLTLDILPVILKGLASLSYGGMGARLDFSAATEQWYRKNPDSNKGPRGLQMRRYLSRYCGSS